MKEYCEVCHGSGVVRAGSEDDGWFSAECDYCEGTGETEVSTIGQIDESAQAIQDDTLAAKYLKLPEDKR